MLSIFTGKAFETMSIERDMRLGERSLNHTSYLVHDIPLAVMHSNFALGHLSSAEKQ